MKALPPNHKGIIIPSLAPVFPAGDDDQTVR
jgi:hypothetical protein